MKQNIVWKAFRELFLASRSMFLASYSLTLLQGLSRVLPIVALQLLFDRISVSAEKGDLRGILWYLLIFTGARIVCHVIDFAVNYLYETYDMIAGYGMNRNVNRKVYAAKAVAFEQTAFLEKVNKAYRGTKSIRKFIDTWMLILLLYLPETMVILLYLYKANPNLPLIFLLILLPSAAVLKLQEKEFSEQEEIAANLQRKIDIYHKLMFDIRNIIETKVVGYEGLLSGKAKKCVDEKAEQEYVYQKKKNNLEHIQKLLIIIGHIGIFGVLVWCTANQIITVGVFAALATSLGELFEMAEEILSVIAEGVSEELEKIRNYFKMIEDIESGTDSGAGGARLEDLASIDFEQVSFRYPGAPQNALEDISFHIDKGEHIAVVGENGSGKSTLVKLLCGIYECDGGCIRLNQTDSKTYEKTSLYRQFTAVFQNYGRYAMTLDENIELAEKMDADRLACTKGLQGLESLQTFSGTEVLSREFGGTDLSGGQWQRIAIARAKYRDGAVYLLDEPTSAIDPNEERRLYDLFQTITAGKTALIVTHRMSAARLAEKIMVLKAGRLCGFGTHEMLWQSCGEYRRLWSLQAEMYK
ncbi:MAG: ATP-binding cassette domain-containing protein [Lachnospiraceae bacterium]|jgi:ATP-binding cassette subfamily B protein|nr:ATP-binding cassette domain-containing protein [Lachnospiraceae bacterium]